MMIMRDVMMTMERGDMDQPEQFQYFGVKIIDQAFTQFIDQYSILSNSSNPSPLPSPIRLKYFQPSPHYRLIQCWQLPDLDESCLKFIINMSYIIDQYGAAPLWNISLTNSSSSNHLSNSSQQARREALLSIFRKNKESFLSLMVVQDQVVAQLPILREWLIILTLRLRPQRGAILSVRLLTPQGHPLAIHSYAQRLIFCKLASVRSLHFTFLELKVHVGLQNGEVRMESPVFHWDEVRGVEQLLTVTLRRLQDCLVSWPLKFAMDISQTCDEIPPIKFEQDAEKMYYFSQFTNIFINLATGPTNQENFRVDQQRKEINAIEILKNNYRPSILGSGESLFCNLQPIKKRGEEIKNFEISYLDRDQLIKMTAPEKTPPPNKQVPYILSHIQLGNTGGNVVLRQMSEGGYATIFLIQMVEYKYVQSFRVEGQPSEPLQNFPTQRRPVVVKRDKPPKQNERTQRKVSRVAHQRKILHHIKCGMAKFLPSYYIVTDEGSIFANDLLMDKINFPSLRQFCIETKQSLSLQSKIYLVIMIAEALRYLHSYRIVHLDLKPQNIMLSKQLRIKLIDFGEAYHPDVKSNHRGSTPPYSPPEIISRHPQFSHKSDVFSLGTIMHELFFDFLPFNSVDSERLLQRYRMKTTHQHWYWAPEEAMNYGERLVMPILRLLIAKCLSRNRMERPELQWILLVLRKCIDVIWKQ